MRLGEAVKGEEVVVYDGSVCDMNVVTIIAENYIAEKIYTKKMYSSSHRITLEDIRVTCEAKGCDSIITVIVEGHLEGVIYQYGNSCDDMWYIHGKTEGYA